MTTSLLSRQPRQAASAAGPAFYTGMHCACWLWDGTVDYPLFVSHRRLARYKTLKPATVPAWAIDLGGFTELSTYGEWRTTPQEYVQAVASYVAKVGRVLWAAPQDHICEPAVIYGGVVGGKKFPGHEPVGPDPPAPHGFELRDLDQPLAGVQRRAVPVYPGPAGLDAR